MHFRGKRPIPRLPELAHAAARGLAARPLALRDLDAEALQLHEVLRLRARRAGQAHSGARRRRGGAQRDGTANNVAVTHLGCLVGNS